MKKAVVEDFAPRFAPTSEVLHLATFRHSGSVTANSAASCLGLPVTRHSSLPDVVLWDPARKWVFLIEAVHSFGPISPARMMTLEKLCSGCRYPLVFVTAFLDRNAFRKFAPEIAWDTEVWIAEEPDHMIHFNGDRFLGPRSARHP